MTVLRDTRVVLTVVVVLGLDVVTSEVGVVLVEENEVQDFVVAGWNGDVVVLAVEKVYFSDGKLGLFGEVGLDGGKLGFFGVVG